MPGDFEVVGTEKLRALGVAMKTADKPLKAEIRRSLRKGVKPGVDGARARARATLPKRGGVNEVIARSRMNTQIKTGGRVTQLRVTSRTHDPRIDRGELRHPTHGHGDRWVVQRVPSGWFTQAMKQAAPAIRSELIVSMTAMTARLRSAAK